MTNNRTKQVKKLRNIFGLSSFVIWIGVTVFLVFTAFSKLSPQESAEHMQVITVEAKGMIISIGTTAIIGLLATILIKDKMRTFIWMLDVVLGAILFKEKGMYIVLAIWFVEEYVIFMLYNHYKNLVTINKEIDRR